MKHILSFILAVCVTAALISCTKEQIPDADGTADNETELQQSNGDTQNADADGQTGADEAPSGDTGDQTGADETPNGETGDQTDTDGESELSPAEQNALTQRHYITREMKIEDTLRNVTESDSAYIVEWLQQNEALNRYYPQDRVYEPAGRVVIDEMMYYFIYVSSEMTAEDGTKADSVIAEMLLAMDYSEAYECWWMSDELVIYDNEELLYG